MKFDPELLSWSAPIVPLPSEWIRGPAAVDGDFIVLDERRAERYDLVADAHPHLLADLAVLERDDVVAFVRKHGLLHHGPEAAAPRRERWSQWQNELGLFRATLRLQIEAARVARGDTTSLAIVRGVAHRVGVQDVRRLLPADAASWAATLVAARLSEALETPKPATLGFAAVGSDLLWSVRPSDLLQHAYCLVALRAARHDPIRECEGCPRLFAPRDARQRFHDDTCASKARWQKYKRTPAAMRRRGGGERGKTRKR